MGAVREEGGNGDMETSMREETDGGEKRGK